MKQRRGKMEKNIAIFRGKEVHKTVHENEWWFLII